MTSSHLFYCCCVFRWDLWGMELILSFLLKMTSQLTWSAFSRICDALNVSVHYTPINIQAWKYMQEYIKLRPQRKQSYFRFCRKAWKKLFTILLFVSKEELKALHISQNHKILEFRKLEGIHGTIESSSLTPAGLPNTKPHDQEHRPDSPQILRGSDTKHFPEKPVLVTDHPLSQQRTFSNVLPQLLLAPGHSISLWSITAHEARSAAPPPPPCWGLTSAFSSIKLSKPSDLRYS